MSEAVSVANQESPKKNPLSGLPETGKAEKKTESHNTRKEIAKDLRAQKNAENPTESATQKYPGFYAFCFAVSKKETAYTPSNSERVKTISDLSQSDKTEKQNTSRSPSTAFIP